MKCLKLTNCIPIRACIVTFQKQEQQNEFVEALEGSDAETGGEAMKVFCPRTQQH